MNSLPNMYSRREGRKFVIRRWTLGCKFVILSVPLIFSEYIYWKAPIYPETEKKDLLLDTKYGEKTMLNFKPYRTSLSLKEAKKNVARVKSDQAMKVNESLCQYNLKINCRVTILMIHEPLSEENPVYQTHQKWKSHGSSWQKERKSSTRETPGTFLMQTSQRPYLVEIVYPFRAW